MNKVHYLITINWKGEVHSFYCNAISADQALRHATRQLARKVGYTTQFVRNYVMDKSYDRWKVEIR